MFWKPSFARLLSRINTLRARASLNHYASFQSLRRPDFAITSIFDPGSYNFISVVHSSTRKTGSDVLDKIDERHELLKRTVAAFDEFARQEGLENRAERDHSTRAFRIPTEVYIQIFEWLRCHYRFRIKDAMSVSHVSRRWRDVALGTPTLWTRISTIRKELIEVFLIRSKTAPLEIIFWTKSKIEGEPDIGPALSDFLAPLLPHLFRWGSLSMSRVEPHFLAPHLLSPAPQLRALTLSRHEWQRDDCHELLSATPFIGGLPCLRELSLAGVFFSPSSPLYAGLTKLHFRHVSFSVTLLSLLLRTLSESSPRLEELHFYWKFLDYYGAPSWGVSGQILIGQTQNPFPLPSLREIVIKGAIAAVARWILSSIYPSPSVRLEISTAVGNDEGLRGVLPSYSDVLNTLPFLSSIDHLHVLGPSYPHRELLSLHGKAGGIQLLTIHFTPNPYTKSNYPDARRDILRSIGGTQTYFPSLEGLTFCDITTRQFHPGGLTQVIANMPRVDQLAFHSCSRSLVEALTINGTQKPFPHMTSLHIHRSFITAETLIKLVKSRVNVDDVHIDSWTALQESNFRAACIDSCASLDTLILSQCDKIDTSTVAVLKKLVRDVQWDDSRHIGS
ncbi:hypothetical protein BOTBODRAFT_36405 [Botryobasidium botryosum FD-172 SS1]|uniref:F-box domain-containing protein n=1 Tax=Botryobasidium botryosum (strain FD-172 SS1) TaxID=930990 RepID=A0A067M6I1_BOTB1|nr:hypothetical protein BOTBODRAFT_36405 [Botryobasidium botryosum FD-172 SS1]